MHISGSRSFFAHVLCAVALTPLASSMSIPADAGMKRDTCRTGYLRISVDEAHRAIGGSYLSVTCAGCHIGTGNEYSSIPVLEYTTDDESATLLSYCPGFPGTIVTAQGPTYWIGAHANSTNFWNTAELSVFTAASDYSSPTLYAGEQALTHIFKQPAPNANQNNIQLTWANEGDMYLSVNNGFSLKPMTGMTPSVYFEPLSSS